MTKHRLQIISVKNFSKFRLILHPLMLIKQRDFFKVILKLKNQFINFALESCSFFVFNLTYFEHLINIMILMNQKIILCPSHLNGSSNFREHLFDMCGHVIFSFDCLFMAFVKDFLNEMFVFNYIFDSSSCFLMCIDKIDYNVI